MGHCAQAREMDSSQSDLLGQKSVLPKLCIVLSYSSKIRTTTCCAENRDFFSLSACLVLAFIFTPQVYRRYSLSRSYYSTNVKGLMDSCLILFHCPFHCYKFNCKTVLTGSILKNNIYSIYRYFVEQYDMYLVRKMLR